ncbi:MAG TPA: GreA/GreB family elongation factor [Egibacteraceae bacterium]|nr:GreA/GreB family elongation factor [Egibacteraceae bacterium]
MAVPAQLEPTLLTTAGRRDLQRQLDRTLVVLAELAERMSAGERGADELAEHRQLLRRVQALSAALQSAGDLASLDEDPSIVELGDEVDVEMPDGQVDTYALVHPVEARASDGRVSITSPLGRALLGSRPGDRVTVDAPAGAYTCLVRGRRRLL